MFLAIPVEAVEALTIVLAAGAARDWHSALTGLLAGPAVLAVVVAVLRPAVSAIPLDGLRLFVGSLLLMFGLQWLRMAPLRQRQQGSARRGADLHHRARCGSRRPWHGIHASDFGTRWLDPASAL